MYAKSNPFIVIGGVATRFTIYKTPRDTYPHPHSCKRRREAMSQLRSHPPSAHPTNGDAPAAMLILRDGVLHGKIWEEREGRTRERERSVDRANWEGRRLERQDPKYKRSFSLFSSWWDTAHNYARETRNGGNRCQRCSYDYVAKRFPFCFKPFTDRRSSKQCVCAMERLTEEGDKGERPANHSVMLLPRWIEVSIGSRAHLENYANQVPRRCNN